MPYHWVKGNAKAPAQSGAFFHAEPAAAPLAVLRLWPHRSLSPQGFVLFIALTCGLIALPLVALLGSPILWGLLPFFALAVGGLWYAIERSYRDGRIVEELRIWRDHLHLSRRGPQQQRHDWEANPYWVSLHLDESGKPVEAYLTLKGGGREVELGAFLSPEERRALHEELSLLIGRLRG